MELAADVFVPLRLKNPTGKIIAIVLGSIGFFHHALYFEIGVQPNRAFEFLPAQQHGRVIKVKRRCRHKFTPSTSKKSGNPWA